uniref:Uncharacterized protein n=1 Tax=Rhodosorus marinus TaxID=101924 RepID=A0A7S0BLI7_9RHOD|mmetsp:Transcript_21879/g.31717  ORF Transcript_21879/g.31717 Transcript_21879/m.31717 type:complete len:164 (+) Transcript_21879:134-625(+)
MVQEAAPAVKVADANGETSTPETVSIASLDIEQMRGAVVKAGRDGMNNVVTFIDELPKKGVASVFDNFQSFVMFYFLVCISAYIVFVGSVLIGAVLSFAGAVLLTLIVTLSLGLCAVLGAAAVGLIFLGSFIVMSSVPALCLFVCVNIGRSAYDRAKTVMEKI